MWNSLNYAIVTTAFVNSIKSRIDEIFQYLNPHRCSINHRSLGSANRVQLNRD